jgi:hypothetical protein
MLSRRSIDRSTKSGHETCGRGKILTKKEKAKGGESRIPLRGAVTETEMKGEWRKAMYSMKKLQTQYNSVAKSDNAHKDHQQNQVRALHD